MRWNSIRLRGGRSCEIVARSAAYWAWRAVYARPCTNATFRDDAMPKDYWLLSMTGWQQNKKWHADSWQIRDVLYSFLTVSVSKLNCSTGVITYRVLILSVLEQSTSIHMLTNYWLYWLRFTPSWIELNTMSFVLGQRTLSFFTPELVLWSSLIKANAELPQYKWKKG